MAEPINIVGVLSKLQTTPKLPTGFSRDLKRQLAVERLTEWLEYADYLDASNLEAWNRHRRLLHVPIKVGYQAEAKAFFELLVQKALAVNIGYDPLKKEFCFLTT